MSELGGYSDHHDIRISLTTAKAMLQRNLMLTRPTGGKQQQIYAISINTILQCAANRVDGMRKVTQQVKIQGIPKQL